MFFLHDWRTSDLLEAIEAHCVAALALREWSRTVDVRMTEVQRFGE